MALVEDLSVFFADFGEAATLDGAAVRVIFDNPVGQQLGGVGMLAAQPQVQIATADVPADVEGLTLELDSGATYTVREHTSDGTGISLLLLRAAA